MIPHKLEDLAFGSPDRCGHRTVRAENSPETCIHAGIGLLSVEDRGGGSAPPCVVRAVERDRCDGIAAKAHIFFFNGELEWRLNRTQNEIFTSSLFTAKGRAGKREAVRYPYGSFTGKGPESRDATAGRTGRVPRRRDGVHDHGEQQRERARRVRATSPLGVARLDADGYGVSVFRLDRRRGDHALARQTACCGGSSLAAADDGSAPRGDPVFLGMAVYAFPHFDLSTQRILGVLQRIAICYLAASVIYLWCGVRGQIAWLAGLLAAYWLIMTFAPVPGFGSGRLDVEGNFAHYVDRLVLGTHNYGQTHDWDPEGIVSTLPAIATALFGLLAGRVLQLRRSLTERTTWMFMTGALLVAAGWALSFWMPINKKLWTDSFCLFMAGLDFTACAAFVWVIDGLGWKRPFQPAVIMGMNAIAIYLASEFGAELIEGVQRSDLSDRVRAACLTGERVAAVFAGVHCRDVSDRVCNVP